MICAFTVPFFSALFSLHNINKMRSRHIIACFCSISPTKNNICIKNFRSPLSTVVIKLSSVLNVSIVLEEELVIDNLGDFVNAFIVLFWIIICTHPGVQQ